MARTIDFYFDYISPFAYLAWHELKQLKQSQGVEIAAKPVLFAGLLNANGNIGPAEVEPKRRYIFLHCQRIAQAKGLPFKCPQSHPFRPLAPLRLTLAAAASPQQHALVDALLQQVWGKGLPIDTADALSPVLQAVSMDQSLLERCGDDEIKLALAQATDKALELGVFGVPSMVFEGELFWGVDALPQLRARLTGAVPPDLAEFAAWQNIQASATRKR